MKRPLTINSIVEQITISMNEIHNSIEGMYPKDDQCIEELQGIVLSLDQLINDIQNSNDCWQQSDISNPTKIIQPKLYKLSVLFCDGQERNIQLNNEKLVLELLDYWHNRVDTLSAVLVVC